MTVHFTVDVDNGPSFMIAVILATDVDALVVEMVDEVNDSTLPPNALHTNEYCPEPPMTVHV